MVSQLFQDHGSMFTMLPRLMDNSVAIAVKNPDPTPKELDTSILRMSHPFISHRRSVNREEISNHLHDFWFLCGCYS